MIVAVVSLALAGFVFAAVATALAIGNGKLDGDNRVLTADRTRLRETAATAALELATALSRGEELEAEHEAKIARIYEQIKESGGAAALGDLAVSELERLLSPPKSDADDNPHG